MDTAWTPWSKQFAPSVIPGLLNRSVAEKPPCAGLTAPASTPAVLTCTLNGRQCRPEAASGLPLPLSSLPESEKFGSLVVPTVPLRAVSGQAFARYTHLRACTSSSTVPAQGWAGLVFLHVGCPCLLTAEPLYPLLGTVALDGLSTVQLH